MRVIFLRTFLPVLLLILKRMIDFPILPYLYKSRMMSEYIYYGNQANKVFFDGR